MITDAAAVRDVLETGGHVKAVVMGHDHAGYQTVLGGIPYHVLPAMVEGPAAERNAYAILTLHADGSIELEQFDG